MAYRKFQAERLFTGYEMLTGDSVLITDDEGIIHDIVSPAEAGEPIEQFKGVLSPGFVNCHCHLELSHMRSAIPPGTGMVDFIVKVIQERHASEELITDAIAQAEDEMIENGIVAVGDICNNTFSLSQKSKGHLYYHNFIEASGFPPGIAGDRFKKSIDFFNAYAAQYAVPIESNSIAPHAPYSVSPLLFEKIIQFPGNHILTMHNQECAAEEQLFLNKTGDFLELYKRLGLDISFFKGSGKSSLQTVLPLFLKNQSLIAVHNVTTRRADIESIRQSSFTLRNFYFCVCPNANLYIGNGLPDIDLLAASGYRIVIGTDSLASNYQLSILAEIKTLLEHFSPLSITDVLQWATINGAAALQLDEIVGSFTKGKQPGIILITGDFSACRRLL